jgi:hypothetical protein
LITFGELISPSVSDGKLKSVTYWVKKKKPAFQQAFVPRAGVEPARPKALVFETNASTNSATWAFGKS